MTPPDRKGPAGSADVFARTPRTILVWGPHVPTSEDLSVVLSEFARALVTDFSIEGILDHLVGRIVDILPIDAAGVSLISPTTYPLMVAGSDESAIRYENLQTELNEGPCLAAYDKDAAISIPDLTLDHRFPTFAERALAEGLVAVFTFPLRNENRCLGALDLYRTSVGTLDADEMAAAQTLADVATAYLLSSEARTAKGDFVATVSHELRTPMTSIAGFAELLQDGSGGPLTPLQQEFVESISRNTERLTALADDLLTISGLESSLRSRVREDVDLGHVVKAVRTSLDSTIAARRLVVTFKVPVEPVVVHGFAPDLEALVTNLISNALKFTEDGGWVRCTLDTAPGAALVEVSDNGLGIPKSEQRNLFTKFFRSSTAQEHEIQGSGLGLAIVHGIAQSHGGDVSVVSEHLVGSSFTLKLPLLVGQEASAGPPDST